MIMKLLNKNSLILFVFFKRSNILCTLTNLNGSSLMWTTAGIKKIRGTKKITNTSIFLMARNLYKFSKIKGTISLYVKIKGTSKNKNIFIKALKTIGFNILLIQEKLILPYGGCRKPKNRKL